MNTSPAPAFVILGNQLFPPALLREQTRLRVFMAEDLGLCTYVRHHQQKLVLFLAAMRTYRDELALRGFDVHYETLPDDAVEDYETRLLRWMRQHQLSSLRLWEVEDKPFEQRLRRFATAQGFTLEFLPSPMFLTTREQFREWQDGRRLHMADFYRWQRQRLDVLMERDGRPVGRRWSFDEENRKPLPRTVAVPPMRVAAATGHVRDVIEIVRRKFAQHPGEVDARQWWLPTTRAQALQGLDDFLENRLELFGPYEDALSGRDPFLFHSALTPALNLGLVTPAEVLERATGGGAKTPAAREHRGFRAPDHRLARVHSRRVPGTFRAAGEGQLLRASTASH